MPAGKFTYVIVMALVRRLGLERVDELLTADGNRVYRPTLTGQGESSHLAGPNIDLDTHITDIVNVILWENLHDIVLVGHSYGGMVITGVADRVPDRIKHIIYLDAFLSRRTAKASTTLAGRKTACACALRCERFQNVLWTLTCN